VWDASKIVIVFDHRVPAESEKTATTHKAVREFAIAQESSNFTTSAAAASATRCSRERTRAAGMVLVGTDSHTTTTARSGRSPPASAPPKWRAYGPRATLWFKVPATLRVEVTGEFRPWISAKDLILYIIGKLGAAGADYRAVEFDGPAIRRMTVASRMVLTQPVHGDGREGGVHAGGRRPVWTTCGRASWACWRRYGPIRTRATSGF